MRAEIPTFDGNMNIEGVLDQLLEVQHFFDVMEIPEQWMVKMAAYD